VLLILGHGVDWCTFIGNAVSDVFEVDIRSEIGRTRLNQWIKQLVLTESLSNRQTNKAEIHNQ